MATLSLADIEAQIKEREEQISQLRAAAARQHEEEISTVIQALRQKIAEYGISAKELGLNGKSASARRGGSGWPDLSRSEWRNLDRRDAWTQAALARRGIGEGQIVA
ncbi:MAG TPA: H-NS family nucleoid-associated regulatory protein [Afipia sp.]